MEQYKAKLKKDIALNSLLALAVIAVCTASFLGLIPKAPGERFGDFMQGFLLGLSGTVVVFFIVGTIRTILMMKNETKLRNAYIKENDERTKFIASKTGGRVMHTSGVIILVAAIISGYFSSTVFFSLLGCSMFLMLIIIVLTAYYGRKF
ncbi:MAG: hypothetical protein ACC608_06585 [Anaerofustis sp.]